MAKLKNVTIKDLLIAPYEIDVDSRNFIVILPKRIEAGPLTKPENVGKIKREELTYYQTLAGALTYILEKRISGFTPEISGCVVSLKEFIAHQQAMTDKMQKMMEVFVKPFKLDFSNMPTVTPKMYLNHVNGNQEELEEEDAA